VLRTTPIITIITVMTIALTTNVVIILNGKQSPIIYTGLLIYFYPTYAYL
jgi:hypothetical protein